MFYQQFLFNYFSWDWSIFFACARQHSLISLLCLCRMKTDNFSCRVNEALCSTCKTRAHIIIMTRIHDRTRTRIFYIEKNPATTKLNSPSENCWMRKIVHSKNLKFWWDEVFLRFAISWMISKRWSCEEERRRNKHVERYLNNLWVIPRWRIRNV